MVKVLTLGDPHFKVNNVQDSEEMTEKFVELSKNTQPDFIVVMGDVLDRHSSIHVIPLMKCEELIKQLSEIAPTFVLVGNHDRPNNSNFLTDEHPFNALKHWNNTYVIDKVMEIYYHGGIFIEKLDKCEEAFRFIFVPYVPPGRFEEALNTIENPFENVTAYFAHQEIYGAKMGAIVSQCGDKWDLKNSLMISGHVHDRDNLQPNMIYVGTPFQHTYNEDNKTVSLFTFYEDKKWGEERIDLGLKKKITIYITPEKVPMYEPPDDKVVKLIIRGEESEIKTVAKLDKINELKKKGVKIAFKVLQNTENPVHTAVPKMNYKDRLLLELKNDEESVSWFNKIFQ
jgi:Marseillevirus putative DNA repair exonuclease